MFEVHLYDSHNSSRLYGRHETLAEARGTVKVILPMPQNQYYDMDYHNTTQIEVGKAVVQWGAYPYSFEEWEWTSLSKRVERVSWSNEK